MKNPLCLFVLEDDDDIALLLQMSLERAGHEVTRCRTAADALIVLEHGTYDLIVLDQRLPDMEGMELVERLSRENVSLPILMVTAHGDEELATNALQAGVLDYVAKDPELTFLTNLPRRIEECVEKHSLRHLNELLIHSLESARDGIMITDLRGNILHVNQALIDLTGYTREELIGEQPRLFKSGQHPPEIYVEMWTTILGRESWQGELTNRRKDGTLFDASITISPIVDAQGRLTHFVGIQRDVTNHKELERQFFQAHKMQSVGTLAGGVAHEFNNLLAGINGYAALGLREEDVPPTVQQFLQHVVDLSERAAGLTGQLLAFARQPTLLRQTISTKELLQRTRELVEHTLHVQVDLKFPESTENEPWLIEADFNQLQQAIINLALNARDATAERARQEANVTGDSATGVPTPVIFRLREVQIVREQPSFPQSVPPGSYLVIEVEDTGCGMSEDVLEQSVDPFFTTKDVGQGTGLGLSVVFGILQAHQGFLTIASKVSVGTTMGLYVPHTRVVSSDAVVNNYHSPQESLQVAEPESSVSLKILVIDDEEAVLQVVRRFLEIAGHQVQCATSGREALQWLESMPRVDLVILDLLMPRENSLQILNRIRDYYPDLPVLICTGTIGDDQMKNLLEAGAKGPLRKPFRMTELWHAVKLALQT